MSSVTPAVAQSGSSDFIHESVHTSADFVSSVGINTRFTYTGTVYDTGFSTLMDKLELAHIHHIRDGALSAPNGPFTSGDMASRFSALGNAGITTTFTFGLNASQYFVQNFPARVTPGFEAYENPNELNLNASVSDWPTVLKAWMPVFYNYVKSNPATQDYPVIGPSLALTDLNNPYALIGNQSAFLDQGNIHDYQAGPAPNVGWGGLGTGQCSMEQYATIDFALCYANDASGPKAMTATETGWGSTPGAYGHVNTIVQAKYLTRLLFMQFNKGIKRTFIYQLVDQGTDGFGDYGLITASLGAKPSYQEIRQILTLLDDKQTVPTYLSWNMSGDISNVQHTFLVKPDGSFYLALWLDVPSWNPSANGGTGTETINPPQAIQLHFAGSVTRAQQLNFSSTGSMWRTLLTPASTSFSTTLSVSVGDNVTLIHISQPVCSWMPSRLCS